MFNFLFNQFYSYEAFQLLDIPYFCLNFKKLNGADVNRKPKAHFIRHYPEMIGPFGPLIKTVRFEVKHSSSPYLA